MRERAVVHLNVAHFAVSVERVVDPRLRGRPVILAPQGAARAVVHDMSPEAYQAGVRKGMLLSRASRVCRDADLVTPHPERYERAMVDFLRRALPYTPLVEAVDRAGHLFLDLSGTSRLFGPPPDVAWRLRNEVRDRLGLDPIWSLAPNKLVAKVASRLVKPTGEYMVEPGEEEAFLRPLPLNLLPGLERPELLLLRDLNLKRVGQLASLSLEQVQVVVGSGAGAARLHEAARGIDLAPVLPAGQGPPRVHEALTFAEDRASPAAVEGGLYRLAEKVGRDLRDRGLVTRRVGLTLDYADGARLIRSAICAEGTANDLRLFALARQALARAWTRRVRLRHLRLTGDRLTYPPCQLELFALNEEGPAQRQRENQLVSALDTIRDRFGTASVQMGITLP